MPDPNAMTDERIEEIIQSERAYQQATTQLQRFVRVISLPLDLTSKLGNNDAQISQYLEKRLPEARKELVALEVACQRVNWTGTDEVLTALYASETDGIYLMALLKLNGQQWWNSEGEEIPNLELERRHLVDLLFYTARDWASWFSQAKHGDYYLVTRWLASNLSPSVVDAPTVTDDPQPERNLLLMIAFSEVTSMKFVDAKKLLEEKTVSYRFTKEEEVILPVVDGLRRGACRPSAEEEIKNQVRLRSMHRQFE